MLGRKTQGLLLLLLQHSVYPLIEIIIRKMFRDHSQFWGTLTGFMRINRGTALIRINPGFIR